MLRLLEGLAGGVGEAEAKREVLGNAVDVHAEIAGVRRVHADVVPVAFLLEGDLERLSQRDEPGVLRLVVGLAGALLALGQEGAAGLLRGNGGHPDVVEDGLLRIALESHAAGSIGGVLGGEDLLVVQPDLDPVAGDADARGVGFVRVVGLPRLRDRDQLVDALLHLDPPERALVGAIGHGHEAVVVVLVPVPEEEAHAVVVAADAPVGAEFVVGPPFPRPRHRVGPLMEDVLAPVPVDVRVLLQRTVPHPPFRRARVGEGRVMDGPALLERCRIGECLGEEDLPFPARGRRRLYADVDRVLLPLDHRHVAKRPRARLAPVHIDAVEARGQGERRARLSARNGLASAFREDLDGVRAGRLDGQDALAREVHARLLAPLDGHVLPQHLARPARQVVHAHGELEALVRLRLSGGLVGRGVQEAEARVPRRGDVQGPGLGFAELEGPDVVQEVGVRVRRAHDDGGFQHRPVEREGKPRDPGRPGRDGAQAHLGAEKRPVSLPAPGEPDRHVLGGGRAEVDRLHEQFDPPRLAAVLGHAFDAVGEQGHVRRVVVRAVGRARGDLAVRLGLACGHDELLLVRDALEDRKIGAHHVMAAVEVHGVERHLVLRARPVADQPGIEGKQVASLGDRLDQRGDGGSVDLDVDVVGLVLLAVPRQAEEADEAAGPDVGIPLGQAARLLPRGAAVRARDEVAVVDAHGRGAEEEAQSFRGLHEGGVLAVHVVLGDPDLAGPGPGRVAPADVDLGSPVAVVAPGDGRRAVVEDEQARLARVRIPRGHARRVGPRRASVGRAGREHGTGPVGLRFKGAPEVPGRPGQLRPGGLALGDGRFPAEAGAAVGRGDETNAPARVLPRHDDLFPPRPDHGIEGARLVRGQADRRAPRLPAVVGAAKVDLRALPVPPVLPGEEERPVQVAGQERPAGGPLRTGDPDGLRALAIRFLPEPDLLVARHRGVPDRRAAGRPDQQEGLARVALFQAGSEARDVRADLAAADPDGRGLHVFVAGRDDLFDLLAHLVPETLEEAGFLGALEHLVGQRVVPGRELDLPPFVLQESRAAFRHVDRVPRAHRITAVEGVGPVASGRLHGGLFLPGPAETARARGPGTPRPFPVPFFRRFSSVFRRRLAGPHRGTLDGDGIPGGRGRGPVAAQVQGTVHLRPVRAEPRGTRGGLDGTAHAAEDLLVPGDLEGQGNAVRLAGGLEEDLAFTPAVADMEDGGDADRHAGAGLEFRVDDLGPEGHRAFEAPASREREVGEGLPLVVDAQRRGERPGVGLALRHLEADVHSLHGHRDAGARLGSRAGGILAFRRHGEGVLPRGGVLGVDDEVEGFRPAGGHVERRVGRDVAGEADDQVLGRAFHGQGHGDGFPALVREREGAALLVIALDLEGVRFPFEGDGGRGGRRGSGPSLPGPGRGFFRGFLRGLILGFGASAAGRQEENRGAREGEGRGEAHQAGFHPYSLPIGRRGRAGVLQERASRARQKDFSKRKIQY